MSGFKEYTSRKEANEKLAAIDKALGLPRKGVNVGAGPHAVIPEVYTKGAIGWTETECSLEEHADGSVLVALTDAAAGIGKRDVVVTGKTVSVDMTLTLADKPEKFLTDEERAERLKLKENGTVIDGER